MTNKGNKRGKKPLQTTLGKAPGQNEKEVDLSHLRRPIDTSVFGLRQVLSLFNTATDEVKNYITYECDIIYECRVCKTIFRSLANFILHKRSFCREKFASTSVTSIFSNIKEPSQPPQPPQSITNIELRHKQIQVLDPDNTITVHPTTKGLSPVIEKLKEKQEINQLTQEIINKDFSNENQEVKRVITNNDLLLEEIATNNAAMFQTFLQDMPEKAIGKPELIKSEVMEIHGMLQSDEAVLGADGKICTFQTNKINSNPIIPKLQLVCTECNMQFSTKKTLTFHLKNKHNDTSLVYVCPDCKDTFANSWCVYRHLYKVHRKTSAQVKRLREQVHNGVIRKDCEPNKKLDKKEPEKLDKTDEENQWLNNIEGDNDFQMCGGCGKRFERKAALHSHATMCIKRIAVCNTIKENNAKKKEEESKDTKTKTTKIDKTITEGAPAPVKGASKRKPYLLRTYKTIGKIVEVPDVNDNKIVCDDSGLAFEDEHTEKENKDGSVDSEALTSIKYFIETDKNLFLKSENNSDRSFLKKPHTVGEFDLLCKRVLEHLRQNGISGELEKAESKQELKSDTIVTRSDDVFVESVTHAATETSSELEMNTSLETPVMSPCRISIRSLDDLIGFSKEEQEQPIVIPTVETPSPTRKRGHSPRSPRVPRSPRSPRKTVQRMNKRKRTKSLDLDGENSKKSDFESDDQDLTFMTRAAPYMDGLKLACRSCKTDYPTLSKLLGHMSTHFSWFRFQCSKCSFITFSRTDCAKHAEKAHDADKSEIGGIVLPIPNWKTALMSNEFRELRHDQNLCGIDADVAMVGCASGEKTARDAEKEMNDNIIDTLFLDSDTETAELLGENVPFPGPILGETDFIKTESIDIIDEGEDSFKIELPDELYSVDIFDVLEIDSCENDRYGCRNEIRIKTEGRDKDDFVIPELVPKVQAVPDPKLVSIKTEDAIVNLRPIRNRMRSIRTLQDDFFYDLKGAKASDAVAGKTNGVPKLRKVGPNVCTRREKSMRVYSKKSN